MFYEQLVNNIVHCCVFVYYHSLEVDQYVCLCVCLALTLAPIGKGLLEKNGK